MRKHRKPGRPKGAKNKVKKLPTKAPFSAYVEHETKNAILAGAYSEGVTPGQYLDTLFLE